MPSHAMLIAIVVTKEDSNSLTQGFAKYQPAKDEFKIVHWKYFYLFEKPYTNFSVGDVVMFAGKFLVENLEQYIIVSNVSVIAPNKNDQKLVTEEVPLSYNSFTNSKRVLMKLRILYPTNAPRFTYIHANNSIKSGRTFLMSGFVRHVNPEAIAIEATDIDFMYANNAIISYNRHDVSSMTISSQRSAFNDIVDEIESTISQVSKKTSTRNLKRLDMPPLSLTSTSGKKKISDLALDCLGLNVVDEQESKGNDDSKAPDDEVEDLEEYVLKERPKKRRRKNVRK
ncbi:16251_t:CDS:2 [Cetraspora pellucida]|uniref:16251_t:CDS:1 n=1 Tax=Cetraspora pellucida TaxID=1433469 RepID=A0ACA9KWS4_9GLOM|nr:16251_t:CDS:2 [Cetraspora pellucida]